MRLGWSAPTSATTRHGPRGRGGRGAPRPSGTSRGGGRPAGRALHLRLPAGWRSRPTLTEHLQDAAHLGHHGLAGRAEWWQTWEPTNRASPRGRREPAAAARAPLVRGPTDRQDHPGRRASLASPPRPQRGASPWPNADRWRCGSPVRHGRGSDRRQPDRQGAPAQAPGDPEEVFGEVKRRALTPEEAGRLLAGSRGSGGITCRPCSAPACALVSWPGCAGAGSTRSSDARARSRPTRYEASRFGNGFTPRPKSDAGVRPSPRPRWWSRRSAASFPPGSDPSTRSPLDSPPLVAARSGRPPSPPPWASYRPPVWPPSTTTTGTS